MGISENTLKQVRNAKMVSEVWEIVEEGTGFNLATEDDWNGIADKVEKSNPRLAVVLRLANERIKELS